MGKTIGVVSLKGGVGKTSLVSALGAAIYDLNKKVLLVDGNFSAPNLGLHLDILEPEKTIHDVLNRKSNVREAIQTSRGFDVLPAAIFTNENTSPLKLKDRIKFVKRSYDIILIDSSPSLNEETLGVMLASDGLLIVTTSDLPTLSMTLKAAKLAKQRGVNIYGLVINKVHNRSFEISAKDIEATAEIPVLAIIPHDINVLKAQAKFIPSTHHKPKSKGSVEYRKLAAALLGEKYRSKKLRDVFRKVVPNQQEINRTIFYNRVFED